MKPDDYEEKIIDIDEVIGTDIKINPDYYIHNAIIKAQQALINPEVKIGFMQFRILVENVEILAKAANMLPEDYEKEIEAFKATKEYKEETDTTIKSVRLANKKLQYILTEVFSAKVSTTPLKA